MISETYSTSKEPINKKVDFKSIFLNSNLVNVLEQMSVDSLNVNFMSEVRERQGFLFGYENEDKESIEINNLSCLSSFDLQNIDQLSNIKGYFSVNRLDFFPYGVYIISEKFSLTKDILKFLLRMETINPQCILLHFNPLSRKISIKKLTFNVIELNSQAEILNHLHYVDLFNKQYTCNIIEEVKYHICYDQNSKFSQFVYNENIIKGSFNDNKYVEKNFNNNSKIEKCKKM